MLSTFLCEFVSISLILWIYYSTLLTSFHWLSHISCCCCYFIFFLRVSIKFAHRTFNVCALFTSILLWLTDFLTSVLLQSLFNTMLSICEWKKWKNRSRNLIFLLLLCLLIFPSSSIDFYFCFQLFSYHLDQSWIIELLLNIKNLFIRAWLFIFQ